MINDSVNNNPAILKNIDSLTNYGVELDGTDQYVDLGEHVLNLGGKFSFETYVRTSDITNNSTIMCLSNKNVRINFKDDGQYNDAGTTPTAAQFVNYLNTTYADIIEITDYDIASNNINGAISNSDYLTDRITWHQGGVGTLDIKFKVSGIFELKYANAWYATTNYVSLKKKRIAENLCVWGRRWND